MNSYSDIEEFRASDVALMFAQDWLKAQQSGDRASDFHMNLLAWTSDYPHQVLGIVMNLIDLAGDDDVTSDAIGLGPVYWLCENCDDEFIPILQEAIRMHPGLAIYTKWSRENSQEPEWIRLRTR